MDARERAFLIKLRETFRVEAAEHLRTINEGLVRLEQTEAGPERQELLELVFREAHSFKGAARSVNLTAVERLCQSLEGVFSALKHETIPVSPAFFDASHRATDLLARMVTVSEEGPGSDPPEMKALTRMLSSIALGTASTPPEPAPGPPAPPPRTDRPAPETVRITTAKLDPLLLQAEEFLQVTLSAQQRMRRLREIASLSNVGSVLESVAALVKTAEEDYRALKRLTDEHLDSTRSLLLLPVSSLVEGFPKLVRDLCKDKGKEGTLVLTGTEVEADKRILDGIKDALVHLLRNGVDHGIELPDRRLGIGKKSQGTITLDFAVMEGRRLVIKVSDDGAGVDLAGVLAAAGPAERELGSVKTAQEILPLVFESGVSVNTTITEISGRGLGLAIVKEKAEALGGTVAVESQAGVGTTFRLDLPLTLATFHGVTVSVGNERFIVPAANVDRVLRVPRSEIATVGNRETITADGQVLSLVDLGDALGIVTPRTGSDSLVFAVVVRGGLRTAFRVDEIVEEQQMLLKGLGRQLLRVKNIAGVTVLGSGAVVPVLNVSDLLQAGARPAVRTAPKPQAERQKVLVAEDSVTTRAMLRNILEIAGYLVTTAADGAEALERFAKEPFHLVVSDVDMPKMNGFELTARIRTLAAGTDTPIVLVTSLESKEDRARGLDAGASAYLVKSGFDRNNLLTVIERLIGSRGKTE